MNIITDLQEFTDLLTELRQFPAVAIDTEFEWSKTYKPIAALLQLATPDNHYLVDLIELTGYESALKEFLEDQDCIKILHSCSQDLILFKHICDAETQAIFDSQVACSFLGFPMQMGYSKLVAEFLDIELDKACQRSDWTKRPLSDQQLEYASYDVIYLMKIYPALVQRLEDKQFSDAFREECSKYEQSAYYAIVEDDQLYRKVKGAGKLKRPQLATVSALAIWRDKAGQKIDRRPTMVLKDSAIIFIAINKVNTVPALHKVRDMHPVTVRRDGTAICRAVSKSLDLDPSLHPETAKEQIPTSDQKKIEERISKAIKVTADELGVEPQLFITRGILRKIIWDFQEKKVLRTDLLGQWRLPYLEPILKKEFGQA